MLARKVLSRPVRGEARIDQATAATSGGTNSGSMLAAEMNPLQGVFGAHHHPGEGEADDHRQSRAAAAGDQRIGQRQVDIRIGQDGGEVRERDVEDAEPVHHRIGIGERAQQQHGDGIDDEEGEDQEQGARP